MKSKILAYIIISGLVFLFTSSAMAYTIDGNLSDWGVDPGTPGSEDWVPNPGIYYTVEDTTTDYVGPGWGGQKFDAEAMYLTWDSTTLYLALVTGFPNTGAGIEQGGTSYSAGDIAIDFGIDGTYEYGVEIGNHSASYAHPNSWWGFSGDIGGVYKGITWKYSEWPGYEDVPLNMHYTVPQPTLAGNASGFTYVNTYPNIDPLYDHWVVETSIPKSVFGSDWNGHLRVSWTETCGNDIAAAASPEPMSIALFGIGALAALFNIRKKSKR